MANSVPSREYQLIESIRRFCGEPNGRWEIGIGDDCAVRKTSSAPLLLTADTMVENVHFRLDLMTLQEVGFKAIAGSVSDVFAMGGTAESIAINLVFPKSEMATEQIEQLYEGIGEAVELFGTPIIGGDMTSGPCWVIAVTVLGDGTEQIKYRSSGQVGDILWTTGIPGLSALGLDLMMHHGRVLAESIDSEAVAAHVRPIPQRNLMPWIEATPEIHAMIDISDGIGKEVLTIAKESCVGAIVQLPESIQNRLERNSTYKTAVRSASELFLSGGEDYQLLFSAAPEFIPQIEGVEFTRIGILTEQQLSFYIDHSGKPVPLTGGWDHV